VKIHILRVIHLYEADLSLLWGVKWREGMHKAIKTKLLHQGQYGGLPGRYCTSLTYLEELRFDYSKLTRCPVANFDNDATACYDCILSEDMKVEYVDFTVKYDLQKKMITPRVYE
jgi:hypothetical protein